MKLLHTDGVSDPGVVAHFRAVPPDVYRGDPVWAAESEGAVDDCLAQAAAETISVEGTVATVDGRPVARAMAILSSAPGSPVPEEGWIGLFECLPDAPDAGAAVLRHSRRWLRNHGVARIVAPRVDALRAGLQISGFDLPQTVFTAHNPPYYADVFRTAGFETAARMVSVIFSKERAPSFRGVGRGTFSIRSADESHLDEEVARIERFQAGMFAGRIGYVPRSESAGLETARKLLPLLDLDLVIIATDREDRTIGVLICVPDAWQTRDRPDRARLISIGVVPGWQGKRVAMSMGALLAETLIAKGYETLEGSWVMETNRRPQLLAKVLGAKPGRGFALFSANP